MTPTFQLDDPRPIAARAPYTFFLPSDAELAAVGIGDMVQLIFRAIPDDRKYAAERMWVDVTKVDQARMSGRLMNNPDDMPQLKLEDVIEFEREYILSIKWADPAKGAALPNSNTREYWDRCFVDKAISNGEMPIGFMYREEPDMMEDGDKYPDSGWRIRISQGGMSDDEIDAIEFEYVALGHVLNAIDDWLHLIDSPVGSRFWRNPETGLYELDNLEN